MKVGLVILGAVGIFSVSLAGGFYEELINRVVRGIWEEFTSLLQREKEALLRENDLGRRILGVFSGRIVDYDVGLIHNTCGRLPSAEERIRCYNEGFLSAYRHYGKIYYENVLRDYNSPKSYEDLVKGFQAWYLEPGFEKVFEAGKSYSYIESPDIRVDVYYMPQEIKDMYHAFIVKQAQREALIRALAKEYELYIKSGEKSVEQMQGEIRALGEMEQALAGAIRQVVDSFLSGISGGGIVGPVVNAIRSAFTGLVNAMLEQARYETKIKGKELAFDLAQEKREITRDALEGKVNLASLSFMNAIISNMEMEMLRREVQMQRLILEEKVRKDLEKVQK